MVLSEPLESGRITAWVYVDTQGRAAPEACVMLIKTTPQTPGIDPDNRHRIIALIRSAVINVLGNPACADRGGAPGQRLLNDIAQEGLQSCCAIEFRALQHPGQGRPNGCLITAGRGRVG